MSPALEIQIIAALIACSCALLGSFLVLRKMTMLTDAITHAVLPGIAIAFLISHEVQSPWLMVGAALAGVVTVWLVEVIFQSGNLRQDAAIGVVFPALFALGVFLITSQASDVHLDIDAVLLGELVFAPFDRVELSGFSTVPRSLLYGAIMLLVNIVLVSLFYKELVLSSFDQPLAEMLGLRPRLLHYGLMFLVSVTAVFAFDSVGSILVVSFFAVPAATAYLLVNRLWHLIALALVFSLLVSVSGYRIARAFDVSIAGSMSVVCGLLFGLTFIAMPNGGVIAQFLKRKTFARQQAANLLLVHLLHHQQDALDSPERELASLHRHLSWTRDVLADSVDVLEERQLISVDNGFLMLTDAGKHTAERVLLGKQTL